MNKQETLEEAAEKYTNKKGDIPTTKLEDAIFKQGFIDGAKWQQEKMYSEEDMIMFADFFYNYKELLKREKWEILEMSKEDIFKKWMVMDIEKLF